MSIHYRKLLGCFLVMLLPYPLLTQTVSAVVVQQETRQPVGDVFVFWDNTSTGVVTDESGRFTLDKATTNRQTLVFSHLNFELFHLEWREPADLPDTVVLRAKAVVLEEVAVTAKTNPRRFDRRLNRFRSEFLGPDFDPKDLHIRNPENILFEMDRGVLTAFSIGALHIENRKLGYELQFFLERFRSTPDGEVRYQGKVYFKEMAGSRRDKVRYRRQRWKTYQQSKRCFLASLLPESGADDRYEIGFSIFDRHDAFINYRQVGRDELPVQKVETNEYELTLDRILTVTARHIKLKQPPQHLLSQQAMSDTPTAFKQTSLRVARSYLWSAEGRIRFDERGIILNGKEVEESGYWANQRVAHLLPFDYQPRVRVTSKLQ